MHEWGNVGHAKCNKVTFKKNQLTISYCNGVEIKIVTIPKPLKLSV